MSLITEQLQQVIAEHETYLHHNNPALLGQLKQLASQGQILYVLKMGWNSDYPENMSGDIYYWSLKEEKIEKEKLKAEQEYPNAEFEVIKLGF